MWFFVKRLCSEVIDEELVECYFCWWCFVVVLGFVLCDCNDGEDGVV